MKREQRAYTWKIVLRRKIAASFLLSQNDYFFVDWSLFHVLHNERMAATVQCLLGTCVSALSPAVVKDAAFDNFRITDKIRMSLKYY